MYFDGAGGALLGLSDVHLDIGNARSGAWQITRSPYHDYEGHYVLENDDPARRRHLWVKEDGGLVFQSAANREQGGRLWDATSEFEFVSDEELVESWGVPTIPWPLEAPDWQPVISHGELVAPDLGATRARVKG